MELVEVEITGMVITHRYGTLQTGTILRTDKEYADHLVNDCVAAKYTAKVDAPIAPPAPPDQPSAPAEPVPAEAPAAEVAEAAAEPPPLAPSTAKEKSVKARVLVACEHGQPNDVVTLSAAVAQAAEKTGQVDTNKAAVAYALSL